MATPSHSARPGQQDADADADAFLAEQCLRCLNGPETRSLKTIGRLLRSNLTSIDTRPQAQHHAGGQRQLVPGRIGIPSMTSGLPYEYASKYWLYHLLRNPDPAEHLLASAGRFLHSLAFVHWAEYTISRSGERGTQDVWLGESKLRDWHRCLPANRHDPLQLDGYATTAYLDLVAALNHAGDDNVLPWLALVRLGGLYQDMSRPDEAVEVREKAASGLMALLGRRNPLTLLALRGLGAGHLATGQLDKAHAVFVNLAQERETIGPDSREYWLVMYHLGQTQYLLADYATARDTLDAAVGRLAVKCGVDSRHVMMAQLCKELVNVRLGERELARVNLRRIAGRSQHVHGDADPVTLRLRVACGALERISGETRLAVEIFEAARATWTTTCPSTNFLSVDLAVDLAAAYWDHRQLESAHRLLKNLLGTDPWVVPNMPLQQRYQVDHLDALLMVSDGLHLLPDAVEILSYIISSTPRASYSRAFFWLLLEYADLARRLNGPSEHGADPVRDSFRDILRSTAPSEQGAMEKQEDSCRLLKLAERALRLLREDKRGDLEELFALEQVAWVRPRDLWLFHHVPGLDTAWLRRFEG